MILNKILSANQKAGIPIHGLNLDLIAIDGSSPISNHSWFTEITHYIFHSFWFQIAREKMLMLMMKFKEEPEPVQVMNSQMKVMFM